MKLLKSFLKLKVEIPWLKISSVSTNSDKPGEYVFYKSAVLIGKNHDCDITVKNADFDEIEIKRSGNKYFLDKKLSAKDDDLIDLVDGDCIELNDSKIKVNFGKISIPVYAAIASLVIFAFLFVHLTSIEEIEPLNEFKKEQINIVGKKSVQMKTKEFKVPKPNENKKVAIAHKIKRQQPKLSQTLRFKDAIEDLCNGEDKNNINCKKIMKVSEAFELARKHMIKGETYNAKKYFEFIKKSVKALPERYVKCCLTSLAELKINIASHECKKEFNEGNFVLASKKCSEAMKSGKNEVNVIDTIRKLENEAMKLYSKAYMQESMNVDQAREMYEKVLAITDEQSDSHKNAYSRLMVIRRQLSKD